MTSWKSGSRERGSAPAGLVVGFADPVGWDMLEASFHRELAGFSGGRVVFLHAAGAIGPIGFAGRPIPVITGRASCSTPRHR